MATGGMQAKLSSKVQNYANEIAKDEINHVSIAPSSCTIFDTFEYKAGTPVMQAFIIRVNAPAHHAYLYLHSALSEHILVDQAPYWS